jgi:hypothetical protein
MRCDHGQASLEYVGVVGLIVAVLGALAVPAGAGGEIAGGVVRQIHRALCVVRAGECELDRRPCVVASEEERGGWHVNLGIVRVGREGLDVREERSDGTVATTHVRDLRGGAEGGYGEDIAVSLAGHRFAAGRSARLSALVRLGAGTTEVRRGERVVTREHVLRGGVGVALSGMIAGDGLDAQGSAAVEVVLGRVRDDATGRTSYVLRATNEMWGAVSHTKGDVELARGNDVALTLTQDRDGRFVDLGVAASGELHGRADIPVAALPVLGQVRADLAGGARWTLEHHLDLTDATNAAAAGEVVAALRHPDDPGRILRAARGLGTRLVNDGVTDVGIYALEREDAVNGAHVARGVRVGGGHERHVVRTRLLAALQRGTEGVWRRRADCLD